MRTPKQKTYSGESEDEGERPDITNRVLGVAGKGDYLFNGTWWVPRNHQIHAEHVAPYMVLPESVNYLTFPGDLAVVCLSSVDLVIRNEGTAPLTIYDLWTTSTAFTVSPEQLLVAPGSTGTLTLTFTATVGEGSETTTGGEIVPTGEEVGFWRSGGRSVPAGP